MKRIILCFVSLVSFANAQQLDQMLNKSGPALVGSKWVNSEKPIVLAERKGKVTIVHFWTFACSNCKANLDAYDRMLTKFKSKEVQMIGIHTPELDIEKNEKNVEEAVKKLNIHFPVLMDTDGQNWKQWKQLVWPTVYVLDKKGIIRYIWVGELAFRGETGEAKVNAIVEQLLKEKG